MIEYCFILNISWASLIQKFEIEVQNCIKNPILNCTEQFMKDIEEVKQNMTKLAPTLDYCISSNITQIRPLSLYWAQIYGGLQNIVSFYQADYLV